MLIHAILFEVRHHISKSSLSGRLSSLLLNFVHLLQILLGHRIQLGAEPFLGLQRSRLRLRNLIDLKATSHGWVHHDLSRSLDLLQTVERDIIEIAGAVQISLLVSHDLFEKVVSPCFPLLSFQEQVICWRYLIMFVVLDVSYSLVQITVWADAWSCKAVLDLAQEFFYHWYTVFAYYYSLHF